MRVNLRPDEDGAREIVQRVGRQMFPSSRERSRPRRLSQPRGPDGHLRTNWLGDTAARAGQRSVRSARARTRVPTPGVPAKLAIREHFISWSGNGILWAETGGRFQPQNAENGRNSVRRPRHASLTERNCEGFCRPGNRVGLPVLYGGRCRDRTDGHRWLASLQNEAARRGFGVRNEDPLRVDGARPIQGPSLRRAPVRAAVRLAGKIPPEAGERTPRITRPRTLGASAVRVDPPTSLASAQMHKTIATLPSTEFPNLTELREAIVAETVQAGAAKPSPEVACRRDRLCGRDRP